MNNELPFDNTNPVWYDNDWANDYVDFYLMALASTGDIQYKGISTSSSIPPYNKYMTGDDLYKQIALRTEIVERGRQSGFYNLPDPVPGCRGHLQKPASGKPEDTVPIDSLATRRIIREAHIAGSGNPLVLIMGGPCTLAADAWLIDPSISDKIIVLLLDNNNNGITGFNGWSDGWAASIVLQRLQLVQFTVESNASARITKQQLLELPPSIVREYFLACTPDVICPEGDCDGQPAISLMRKDYISKVNKVSFGGYTMVDGHEVPIFRDDPASRSLVCTEASADIATQEWWRALKNPLLWK